MTDLIFLAILMIAVLAGAILALARGGRGRPQPDLEPYEEAERPARRAERIEILLPPVPTPAPPAAAPRPKLRRAGLNARILANRRWSPGARLIVAAALVQHPPALPRRPRR